MLNIIGMALVTTAPKAQSSVITLSRCSVRESPRFLAWIRPTRALLEVEGAARSNVRNKSSLNGETLLNEDNLPC